ncbi:amino acid adenylation domain-containing protein [Puniceibacterium sediminis]|uniref:Amino acid adenylation domain-containing protein n=1 Tax=Puniceibacterium sediminis TaxID=1608407 RepID=A0A238YUQ5_9RHOB|nr:amino acid adenylation domain-containing protein [Puniceibacterium sediminis]SNR74528.1 amino acid adenylation domain-containing protein [Puniceibacterium sediminis]
MTQNLFEPPWSADCGPGPWGGKLADLGGLLRMGDATTPDKVAVADPKTELTYRDLETAALNMAHILRDRWGITPGDRVVVLTKKWPIVPAIAVAIWKLRAVYVPIDADLPAERLSSMIGRARPALTVGFGPAIVQGHPHLDISDWHQLTKDRPDDIVRPLPGPDDIAYIIHTSGSTGKPKGVQITHQSLSAYFHAHNQMLQFGAGARVLSFAPFHFDVSIEDTLLPLSVGAFVYLYNRPAVGMIMRRTLARQRITHLIAVSTLLAVLSDDASEIHPDCFPDLEMIMTGAETCQPAILNLWKSARPDLRVYNVYGPTEVTIVCTGFELKIPEPGRTTAFPIGRPLAGVDIRLLDPAGQDITGADQPGELCLGGVQVMAGYLGDPAATAEQIFERSGVRYYRSGDICSFDVDGDLVFLGRADSQVKLNGRRISLGEIQSECMSLPGIDRAVAGLVARGKTQLIGVVLVSDDPDAVARARRHLDRVLPAYARPSLWDSVSKPNLSGTGKSNDRDLLARLSVCVSG